MSVTHTQRFYDVRNPELSGLREVYSYNYNLVKSKYPKPVTISTFQQEVTDSELDNDSKTVLIQATDAAYNLMSQFIYQAHKRNMFY